MAEYASRDYTVVSGDDWSDDIIITDTNSEIVNLTDYDAEFGIEWKGGEILLTVGDGITITPLDGKIALVLTGEQTQSFRLGRLNKFQLRLTDANGTVTTRLEGFFIVINAVIDPS